MAKGSPLDSALEALVKATSKKKKLNKVVSALSVVLDELKSWNPSKPYKDLTANLVAVFGSDILPIYVACPKQALAVTAATFTVIYGTHLSTYLPQASLTSAQRQAKNEWENVLDLGLFEGLLNYLHEKDADRQLVGEKLHFIVCPVLYHGSSKKLGALLRRQICSFLTDSTQNEKANKARLLNNAILGATRLGELIATTNDYLLMDALMELVIRLAPRANQPDERKAFVDDLFSNSAAHQAFGPSGVKPLIEVLMNMSSDWRKASSELRKWMGLADIKKPQVFLPQVLRVMGFNIGSEDHRPDVVIDTTTLFTPDFADAMALIETSLTTISEIRLAASKVQKSRIEITITLSKPPVPVSKPKPGSKEIQMAVDVGDLKRLRTVLESRGLLSKIKDELEGISVQRQSLNILPVSVPFLPGKRTQEDAEKLLTADSPPPANPTSNAKLSKVPVVSTSNRGPKPESKKSIAHPPTATLPTPDSSPLSEPDDLDNDDTWVPPPPARSAKEARRISSPESIADELLASPTPAQPKHLPKKPVTAKRKRSPSVDIESDHETSLKSSKRGRRVEPTIAPPVEMPKSARTVKTYGNKLATKKPLIDFEDDLDEVEPPPPVGKPKKKMPAPKKKHETKAVESQPPKATVPKPASRVQGMKKKSEQKAAKTAPASEDDDDELVPSKPPAKAPPKAAKPVSAPKAKTSKANSAPWMEEEKPVPKPLSKQKSLPSAEEISSDPFVVHTAPNVVADLESDDLLLDPSEAVVERKVPAVESLRQSNKQPLKEKQVSTSVKAGSKEQKYSLPMADEIDFGFQLSEGISSISAAQDSEYIDGDTTMIDRWNEDVAESPPPTRESRKAVAFNNQVEEHSPVPIRLQKPKTLPKEDTKAVLSVTREPKYTFGGQPQPSSIKLPNTTNRPSLPSVETARQKLVPPSSTFRERARPPIESIDSSQENEDDELEPRPDDECHEIMKVLLRINEGIMENMRTKFEGVRSGVRIARDSVLRQAQQDLEYIKEGNVAGVEALKAFHKSTDENRKEVEKEYGLLRRKNVDLGVQIKQMIKEHDQHVLRTAQTRKKSLFEGKGANFTRLGFQLP